MRSATEQKDIGNLLYAFGMELPDKKLAAVKIRGARVDEKQLENASEMLEEQRRARRGLHSTSR